MSTPFRPRSFPQVWDRIQQHGFGWRSLSLILACLVALLVTNGVSLWSAGVLSQQTAAVEHTREVRRTLDRTERRIIDAIAAQRGYLLTGNEAYVGLVDAAGQAVAEDFQALRALVRDNPAQSRRLDDVRPLIDEGTQMNRQVVRDAREGRFVQALEVVRSSRGAELLVEVKARFEEIDAVERDLLADRQHAATLAQRANFWFSTLGTVLIVLVAGLAIFQFASNFTTIVQAHDELDEANRELETRVKARTADLETAHREVERERDRAEAMLREVNHRVGNSLQLVSSFIALQGRSIADIQAKAAFQATQARIEAVSQVHRRLYTSENMSRVGLREYLASLSQELAQSLCAGERPCSITVEAEALETTTDRAVAVGVLVAELVTNAVKYAYAPEEGGEIRIRLKSEGDGCARLTVEDDGVGVKEGDQAPKGTGLGKTIIAAMARDLKTEVAYVYGPAGLGATLVFDL